MGKVGKCCFCQRPLPCACATRLRIDTHQQTLNERHQAHHAELRQKWATGLLCRICFAIVGPGHVHPRTISLDAIPEPDPSVTGPMGRRLCRLWVVCGAEVERGRRSWCGEACVDWYLRRSNIQILRERVHQRDLGVCAICSLDTDLVTETLDRLSWGSPQRQDVLNQMRADGFSLSGGIWAPRASLWEMDHVVPIVDGGDPWAMENLRSLCQPCHRFVTARDARSRAEARRQAV